MGNGIRCGLGRGRVGYGTHGSPRTYHQSRGLTWEGCACSVRRAQLHASVHGDTGGHAGLHGPRVPANWAAVGRLGLLLVRRAAVAGAHRPRTARSQKQRLTAGARDVTARRLGLRWAVRPTWRGRASRSPDAAQADGVSCALSARRRRGRSMWRRRWRTGRRSLLRRRALGRPSTRQRWRTWLCAARRSGGGGGRR